MTAIVRTTIEFGVIYDVIVNHVSDYVQNHEIHRNDALIRRCAQAIIREMSNHERGFIDTLVILESGFLLERAVILYEERCR